MMVAARLEPGTVGIRGERDVNWAMPECIMEWQILEQYSAKQNSYMKISFRSHSGFSGLMARPLQDKEPFSLA